MAEAAEQLPEEAFELLFQDLQAIYKTDPTIGRARKHKCEIYVNMQEQKFTIYFSSANSKKEQIFFVNFNSKTVHTHKFTKAVKERFDLAPESGVPENNAENIKELRDKLAKFTFN